VSYLAKKEKSNLKYAIIGVIAVLIILLIAGYIMITGSPTVEAFLTIHKGDVQVDHGKGWISAQDGMDLDEKDHVKTLTASEASVVLHESVIINMAPETELFVSDLAKQNLKVDQASGSTWNKFTGLAGVEEFSVETPTTVATVRGTSFEANTDSILVGEGIVEVDYQGETVEVPGGKKAVIRDGKLVVEDLTEEERARLYGRMGRTIDVLKLLRLREVEKHPILAKQMKKQYGITDAEIEAHLEKADRGEYNLDELADKSPVKIKSVYKIKEFTEEIIKLNNLIPGK
jgi:hypothetical protein